MARAGLGSDVSPELEEDYAAANITATYLPD